MFLNSRKQTVVVGMSGGVDSAAAALLLKEEGYNVVGLFMRNWEEEDENGVCAAAADFEDVKAVCGTIGIPYYSVNFSKEYRENVFSYFLAEYKAGRTPNPDVLCNREIKFGPFLAYARGLGADFIATGHYCGLEKRDGNNYLLKAADKSKDQTYFLNQVPAACFDRVLFPLAELQKSEVRGRAAAARLPVADKKDSTGLCFIGERDFKRFLSGFLPAQPGAIKTMKGQEVGRHDGLMYYTLGQRRGLNIGGVKDLPEGRWFVVNKDLERNILYVSCGDEGPLYSRGVTTGKPNWIPLFNAQCTMHNAQLEDDDKGQGTSDKGQVKDKTETVNRQLSTVNCAKGCYSERSEESPPDRDETDNCLLLPVCAAPISSDIVERRLAFKCAAKFRYRQEEQGVTVRILAGGGLRVDFDGPQRAVTPGQYVVFYQGRYCLGGAPIETTE
ncbi:hypothetical protein FACS1894211_09910 [Clostridia bacterium]|nr:hypothetical protein FACS1894211_09910 [Clostridia bacterium]